MWLKVVDKGWRERWWQRLMRKDNFFFERDDGGDKLLKKKDDGGDKRWWWTVLVGERKKREKGSKRSCERDSHCFCFCFFFFGLFWTVKVCHVSIFYVEVKYVCHLRWYVYHHSLRCVWFGRNRGERSILTCSN